MKKLFYLLFLLPFAMMTSCDKDDLASFDMTLTLSGVTQVDGSFYAVAGSEVTVTNLKVTPTGGKNTIAANVMFFLNNAPLFPNPWDVDNPISFTTEGLEAGTYYLGVTGNLLQEGESIQNFVSSYPLVIVSSPEDLPSDAPETGSYSLTINYSK